MIAKVTFQKTDNIEMELPISLNLHERMALMNAALLMMDNVKMIGKEAEESICKNALMQLAKKIARDNASLYAGLPDEDLSDPKLDEKLYKLGLALATVWFLDREEDDD